MQSIIGWLYNRAIRRPLKEDKKQVEKKRHPSRTFERFSPSTPNKRGWLVFFQKSFHIQTKGIECGNSSRTITWGGICDMLGPEGPDVIHYSLTVTIKVTIENNKSSFRQHVSFLQEITAEVGPFFTALYLPLKALKVRHRGAHKCGFITNSGNGRRSFSRSPPPD
ncbi:hypothetical protein CDAR_531151 [Caerostris darwini]|uniref:Uncharacterized protein n=1 Tax=Caerostris darwini TaxID=1538125 RepID=A0AAV4QAE5_9ARAC|nr:hypothetical protein CDAR_531151 [Caerostris darwini]